METLGYVLFFVVLFASFVVNFLHYMHMFQLNSYSAWEQGQWMKKNVGNIILRHVWAVLASLYAFRLALLAVSVAFSDLLICAGILLMGLACCKKAPAKKKLVFTSGIVYYIF